MSLFWTGNLIANPSTSVENYFKLYECFSHANRCREMCVYADWNIFHLPSERLTSLGMMGAGWGLPFNPSLPYCLEVRGISGGPHLGPIKSRDASLGRLYACCINYSLADCSQTPKNRSSECCSNRFFIQDTKALKGLFSWFTVCTSI